MPAHSMLRYPARGYHIQLDYLIKVKDGTLQGRRQHYVINDCFYHKVRVNNRLYSSIKWSTIIHSSRPRLRQTSGVCRTGSTSPVINASVCRPCPSFGFQKYRSTREERGLVVVVPSSFGSLPINFISRSR